MLQTNNAGTAIASSIFQASSYLFAVVSGITLQFGLVYLFSDHLNKPSFVSSERFAQDSYDRLIFVRLVFFHRYFQKLGGIGIEKLGDYGNSIDWNLRHALLHHRNDIGLAITQALGNLSLCHVAGIH
jgi:hypothetical protein